MDTVSVLETLKARGVRKTRTRTAILTIFLSLQKPLSAFDVKYELEKIGLIVNKTTVYRELSFLLKENLLIEVKLRLDITLYESAFLNHHHHLVCENCGSISDIICTELKSPLKTLERRILVQGFEINKHDLEFYGKCGACK
jgi:Fe2+ or Zn2+ uptake regulation protein